MISRLSSIRRIACTMPSGISCIGPIWNSLDLESPFSHDFIEPISGGSLPFQIVTRPDRGGKLRTRKLRMQRKVKRQQTGDKSVNESHTGGK